MRNKKTVKTGITRQKQGKATDYKSVADDYQGRVLAAIEGFCTGRQGKRHTRRHTGTKKAGPLHKPITPQSFWHGAYHNTNTSKLPTGVNP